MAKVIFTGDSTDGEHAIYMRDITVGKKYKLHYDCSGDPYVIDDAGDRNYAPYHGALCTVASKQPQ